MVHILWEERIVSGKKKFLVALLLIVMLASVVAGLVWHSKHYQMVDFTFYPKNADVLDLRGKDISIRHYNKICRQMPGVQVYWDVPFQGSAYANDAKELTVIDLTDEDVELLDYFIRLEKVNASACEDYAQLLALQQRRPEVELEFSLKLGGRTYSRDARNVEISQISAEEIPYLQCLQKLKTVTVCGGETMDNFEQLQKFCHENGYDFCIGVDGASVSDTTQSVTLHNVTETELQLLQFLPNLKQLHLITPQAPVESLTALEQTYPGVAVSWSQMVAGKLFSSTETLIDISNTTVTDLDALAQEMTYFPNVQQLEMHFCGVENEEMAAFREAQRENYKVVWTVYLGPKLPTRTDTTSIMPARDGTSVFHDEEAYNMRYCEDVIAIDVGHLDVRNVEWAAFMPHLKYLILAWTGVRDLTPLANCKELVWLELDNSPGGDTTPLIACTALEDVNIGKSGVDPAGLAQMPWLKNVWAIGRADAAYKIAQGCPDTKVVATGEKTVSGGWRYLPNYYKMRDALNMFYMDQ